MGRLIDIDRLCNDLAKRWSIADKKKENTIRAVMADVVTPIVVSQPTVDAVPVIHGRWIVGNHLFRQCDKCGWERRDDNPNWDTNFCPNCGADMRKDGDHHD